VKKKIIETDGPRTLLEMAQYYSDPEVCHSELVNARWPNGVACIHCGCVDVWYTKSRRRWQCKGCKEQFTARLGTIFEDSPLPLSKWFVAMWLLADAKNGISSYELHRAIGVTQKTAWFMLHRVREVMRTGSFERQLSGTIEADETYIGGREANKHKNKRLNAGRGTVGKSPVLGLIERGDGVRKSRVRVKMISNTDKPTLSKEIVEAVASGSTINTDALSSYRGISGQYVHKWVDHAVRYAIGSVHTNGLENFFSLLKRSLHGTYIAVMPFHLTRYLDEQAFRFNERETDDAGRFRTVLRSVNGKRLTYQDLTSAYEAYHDQLYGQKPDDLAEWADNRFAAELLEKSGFVMYKED
jgi:transposase-like protein